MAVRKILKYPKDEARLRRKSSEVKRLDAEIKNLIRDLKDTLAEESGAGLAAPQIGVYKRVALVSFGQDEGEMKEPFVIINPVIIERGEPARGFDGCLSIPGLVTWDTPRPSWLVFTARDENWKKLKIRAEGIDARVVDHEIDHLDGTLFLDKLDAASKLYVSQLDENGEVKLVEISDTLTSL